MTGLDFMAAFYRGSGRMTDRSIDVKQSAAVAASIAQRLTRKRNIEQRPG
jgi:hypothetical protein